MELNNSADLFAACGSDDPLIQAAAYEILWAYLYQVAWQMVYDQSEAEAMAQDCAQLALVRIHQRLNECREAATFRAWARRIVSHLVIDELRRRKRLAWLGEAETGDEAIATLKPAEPPPGLEETVLEATGQLELAELIRRAPMSERSRRVVAGRYLDGLPDEQLAQVETDLAGQPILPSHIQVTRSKNLVKLRQWQPIQDFFKRQE
jgi:RNA polymerase sigma factor (sigma-70 family)